MDFVCKINEIVRLSLNWETSSRNIFILQIFTMDSILQTTCFFLYGKLSEESCIKERIFIFIVAINS